MNCQVPLCFQKSTIPVPRKTLTSVIMKCFERLVKTYTCDNIPAALETLQLAHQPNRSVEHTVLRVLHTTLEDLEMRNPYSVSDSSILALLFDTIVPTKLVFKPGLGSFHMCLGV